MAKIIVTIDPAGTVTMQGQGFIGTACHDAMQRYQELLGAQKTQQDHGEVDGTEIHIGK